MNLFKWPHTRADGIQNEIEREIAIGSERKNSHPGQAPRRVRAKRWARSSSEKKQHVTRKKKENDVELFASGCAVRCACVCGLCFHEGNCPLSYIHRYPQIFPPSGMHYCLCVVIHVMECRCGKRFSSNFSQT